MKQYQGTSGHDRDPQNVASSQPQPPPAQKTVPNRKSEAEKRKIKASKQGEHRER